MRQVRQEPGGHWQTKLNRRRFLRHGGMSLLVAPLLAACSITTERRSFAVAIQGLDTTMFDPGTLTIPRGARVIWQNHTTEPHTVTCDPKLAQEQGSYAELPENAQPWDSGDLYTGEVWSHTFTTPGKYVYFSRRAERGNLLGSISVT